MEGLRCREVEGVPDRRELTDMCHVQPGHGRGPIVGSSLDRVGTSRLGAQRSVTIPLKLKLRMNLCNRLQFKLL